MMGHLEVLRSRGVWMSYFDATSWFFDCSSKIQSWKTWVVRRAEQLTSEKKKIILRLKYRFKSIAEIARCTGRGRNVITKFLAHPNLYGTKKSPGRPPKVSARDKRRILRFASNSLLTCTQMLSASSLQISVRTVRRTLQESENIKRKNFNANHLWQRSTKSVDLNSLESM